MTSKAQKTGIAKSRAKAHDEALLAGAASEDAEGHCIRLHRDDFENSIEQLEGSYRKILMALDTGEPADALEALTLVLTATECLKSIEVRS